MESDAVSMTTVTCPRCGLAFETAAVTNTRCRRCRTVVQVGPRRAARPTAPTQAPPTVTEGLDDEAAPPTALTGAVGDGTAGVALLVVLAGVAVVVVVEVVRAVLRWRRSGGQVAVRANDEPTVTPAIVGPDEDPDQSASVE